MTQLQVTVTDNELLASHPSQVEAWLQDVWSGEQEAPEDFFWHGLAEGAAGRANRMSLGEPPDLEWAQIAIAVYEKLANEIKPEGKESFLYSAMNLRAALIAKLGEVKGHPVLDTGPILRWFFESLPVSLEEAARQADVWRERGPKGGISMQGLLGLRLIKGRLKIIQSLIDKQRLTPDAELAKWLELRSKLP